MRRERKNVLLIFIIVVIFLLSGCESGKYPNAKQDLAEGRLPRLQASTLEELFESSQEIITKLDSAYQITTFTKDISTPAGLLCRDKDIIIASNKDNCLYVMDYNGNILNKIGKTGNAELEFLNPVAIASNSKNIYILDSSNKRVQIIDPYFKYIKSLSFADYASPIPELNEFCDLEVDNNGNVYVSSLSDEITYILCIDENTNRITKLGENFVGFLGKDNDKIYAINYGIVMQADKEIASGIGTGANYLFELKPTALFLKSELPYAYTSTDFLFSLDQVVVVSAGYSRIDEISLSGNYQKSFSEIPSESRLRYISSINDGTFYISSPDDNIIYKISQRK